MGSFCNIEVSSQGCCSDFVIIERHCEETRV